MLDPYPSHESSFSMQANPKANVGFGEPQLTSLLLWGATFVCLGMERVLCPCAWFLGLVSSCREKHISKFIDTVSSHNNVMSLFDSYRRHRIKILLVEKARITLKTLVIYTKQSINKAFFALMWPSIKVKAWGWLEIHLDYIIWQIVRWWNNCSFIVPTSMWIFISIMLEVGSNLCCRSLIWTNNKQKLVSCSDVFCHKVSS